MCICVIILIIVITGCLLLSQDISEEVPQGKLVAILGPHGSGKFSLLRLLTGLVILFYREGNIIALYTHNYYPFINKYNFFINTSRYKY